MAKKTAANKRPAAKEAKARLSGVGLPITNDSERKNTKIVFGDDDSDEDSPKDRPDNESDDAGDGDDCSDDDDVDDDDSTGNVDREETDDDDDDAVEEVKGSAAREDTRLRRDGERLAKAEELAAAGRSKKKKRRRKDDAGKGDGGASGEGTKRNATEDDEDSDGSDELLTESFLSMVDAGRDKKVRNERAERKRRKKMAEEEKLGRHTTFVVADEYEGMNDPRKVGGNIEVVALGGCEYDDEEDGERERRFRFSATLNTKPSKAALVFARGDLTNGSTKVKGVRKGSRSNKEKGWTRSRKVNNLRSGEQPGCPALIFTRQI